ncbi:MAG: pyruvate kinase, partial [Polyangiaceae bacterium]|nr:pyruvate kinase [Polyangiaceae bacterium]
DGLLQLRVLGVSEHDVETHVEVGGILSDRKGVNLPGAKLSLPALTEKDILDLRFAVDELKVDYLALSFVRSAEHVLEAKRLAGDVPVIAKLEKPEAVENLEEIMDAADGIMVARGDLGVEVGAERVPMIQKKMIRLANSRGKPVITATQMLDSMIRNPRPTRAEAADVANAVLDGSDAVMLSGETASGRYPRESVEMMRALIDEAEASEQFRSTPEVGVDTFAGWEFSTAAARAASLYSRELPLVAVVVITRRGRTAELLSAMRPNAPILALTPDAPTAQRLALRWGLESSLVELPDSVADAISLARLELRQRFPNVNSGSFAMVSAYPYGLRTNSITLQSLEEPDDIDSFPDESIRLG